MTRSVYADQGTLFADLTSGNAMQTRYLHQDNMQYAPVVARNDSNGVEGLLLDRLGSTRNIINGSGTVIGTLAYDGFGNITSESSPPNTGNVTFTGLAFLRSADLLGAKKRVYNPLTGNWDQQDPDRWLAGDPKLDRYVENNPTNATDPTGLQLGDLNQFAEFHFPTPIGEKPSPGDIEAKEGEGIEGIRQNIKAPGYFVQIRDVPQFEGMQFSAIEQGTATWKHYKDLESNLRWAERLANSRDLISQWMLRQAVGEVFVQGGIFTFPFTNADRYVEDSDKRVDINGESLTMHFNRVRIYLRALHPAYPDAGANEFVFVTGMLRMTVTRGYIAPAKFKN